jgi:hypothetical protein
VESNLQKYRKERMWLVAQIIEGMTGIDAALVLESLHKSCTPHMAFGHCAKLHADIKSEVGEKPNQWRGSQVERQVPVSQKIALLLQLLHAGHENCAKSEWSRSDGWGNHFTRLHINQIQIWMNTIQCQRDPREQ